MKISILGTRGIPARYGGFEACAEEISVRLARRGHDVRVYCRSDDPDTSQKEYKGVRLINLPRLRQGFAASPFNSLTTTLHGALSDSDILHFFGCGNVPFCLPARLSGKRVVLSLDGLEWNRLSYSKMARMYLRSFAELATVFPNASVADSRSSQRWYFARTGISPKYIPYGANLNSEIDPSILRKWGLEEGAYLFFAGRLVSEKGVHTLVNAFKSVKGSLKLLIVGDFPGKSEYVEGLKRGADNRTIFAGYVYGKEFETLRNSCLIYIHPSLLEGTSIALLGAMGAGRCIVSSDLPENLDVAGDSALYFERGNEKDLTSKLEGLIKNPHGIRELGKRARERARVLFDWERITDEYEATYRAVLEAD